MAALGNGPFRMVLKIVSNIRMVHRLYSGLVSMITLGTQYIL